MSKNIVLCLDGTWNGPDTKDAHGQATPTNVQKLFEALAGAAPLAATDSEREIEARRADGTTAQVAKYFYGVGDMSNRFAHACAGALGLGLVGRLVRGYTYLSRMYEPGDRIFLVGFSRGAYTARSLAGMVARQGLLDWRRMGLAAGSDASYRAGLLAWQAYKHAIHHHPGLLASVVSFVSDLHAAIEFGLAAAPALHYIGDVGVEAVGVWDTVGALGIPDFVQRHHVTVRLDALRFCDARLHPRVAHGLHAVAIDEQRVDFTPTLWEPRDGVVQVLFPGAHGDVGGSYVAEESGLSDAALAWMARGLSALGIEFAHLPGAGADPSGMQHQPWLDGALPYVESARRFPPGLRLASTVLRRVAAAAVPVQDGPVPDRPYRPHNIVPAYLARDGSGTAPGVVVEP